MRERVELLTINEWCTRYGIKVKNPCGFKVRTPNGFRIKKNQVWDTKYTKGQFRKGIKRSWITVKTEKGLAFLEAM